MTMNQRKEVEQIKAAYAPKEKSKLDELKALDKKVNLSAQVFAYSYGVVGSLALGTGMCLAMKVIGNMMPLGIGVGILGIAMVSTTYYFYKKILAKRRAKYAKQILQLSEDILTE